MCAHVDKCVVPPNDAIFKLYHDNEWGVPTSNDQAFFEKICLEGFQAGLSWGTILHKRNDLREAFANFCPRSLANFSDKEIYQLLNNELIIRNERKIRSVINNAQCFLDLQALNKSLAQIFWSHEPTIEQRPSTVTNQWLSENAFTEQSTKLARVLKKQGWSFVGPTNIYATMQALGIVNDHVDGCPCNQSIELLRSKFVRPIA